ncbi:molybdopterin molybdenumtransferase MoeA [Helicobacter suis]|uniref:molybdopterin molybdotransferase MoeA n=2 Tax=Helicobacter suis TaxID=104628 RepID=UPI00158133C8|nr:molybdopterin molybdotransferase MoeA [Helicobacter suis]GFK16350.1 molybdopterin molybdenumtransferase MoeA [Helicobacter suis]
MLSFAEALEAIQTAFLSPLGLEKVFFSEALGRVLATDIYAPTNNPNHPTSSMDGYAFRQADFSTLQEEGLIVQAINPANLEPPLTLQPKHAIKTFTGAKMPFNSDSLVIVEEVELRGDKIFLKEQSGFYNWIRPVGFHQQKGELLLKKGSVINPYALGLLADINQVFIEVYKKPRVGILSGGEEIIEVGASGEGVRSVNNHMIKAMVEKMGGEGVLYALLPDNQESIEQAIYNAFRDCDMVTTTGGMSKGDLDHTQHAIANISEIAFKYARIKPGKPVAYGIYAKDGTHKPLLALPGNPPSAALTFYLFGHAIWVHFFEKPYTPPFIQAILEQDLEKKEARMEFKTCHVHLKGGVYYASIPKRSHLHESESALLVLEEGGRLYKQGEAVPLLLHHIF